MKGPTTSVCRSVASASLRTKRDDSGAQLRVPLHETKVAGFVAVCLGANDLCSRFFLVCAPSLDAGNHRQHERKILQPIEFCFTPSIGSKAESAFHEFNRGISDLGSFATEVLCHAALYCQTEIANRKVVPLADSLSLWEKAGVRD